MLHTLDFNIDFVSTSTLLERFAAMAKVDKTTADVAQYMIEIALLDYSSIHIKPSYLAISSLYLACKLMKHPKPWNKDLAACSFYTEKYISKLSWVILSLLKSYQKPGTQLVGLKKKFASAQFSRVSTLFQLDTDNNQNTQESSNKPRTQRDTTDKKKTISADKVNNLGSQRTMSTNPSTSQKKNQVLGSCTFGNHTNVSHPQMDSKQSQ